MTNNEVINYMLAADPSTLKDLMSALHKAFGTKAEALYDANPEENGLIAQPYADLGDLFGEAAAVFEEPEQMLIDDELPVEQASPSTVTAAIEARAKNPWGGR